jgi:hypothetical protein
MRRALRLVGLSLVVLLLPPALASVPFRIKVVDQDGRDVESVRLTTDTGIVFQTNVLGNAAVWRRSLMNSLVHFTVDRSGYIFPNSGITLHTRPGGYAELTIFSRDTREPFRQAQP